MFIIKLNKSFLLLFSLLFSSAVKAENLIFQSFGYSNFLIKGGGISVLINPYKPTGCASNLSPPKNTNIDFILASSRLADEGYNPSNKLMFVDPGTYKYKETILNGISVPHDRVGGRRFGMATVWSWTQNNIKIVHMAGAAGNMAFEDKILLSRPDILFISIGGGKKSYNGKEASIIVEELKPKIVIPVHFSQINKLPEGCEFSNEDLFIENIEGFKIKKVSKNFKLNPKKINNKMIYIIK